MSCRVLAKQDCETISASFVADLLFPPGLSNTLSGPLLLFQYSSAPCTMYILCTQNDSSLDMQAKAHKEAMDGLIKAGYMTPCSEGDTHLLNGLDLPGFCTAPTWCEAVSQCSTKSGIAPHLLTWTDVCAGHSFGLSCICLA